MGQNNIIEKLQERGIISQITHEKTLSERLVESTPISLYCGFDPTADSLHVGHLIPLLCLKHFQLSGHRPIILIGGATGLIGDPSFRVDQRQMHAIKIVEKWVEKITQQIYRFLDFDNNLKNGAIIANNYDWFCQMNVITFLRHIGTYFYINNMLNKEAVKKRITRDNNRGISFTEFSYNLLQGYDFAYLNKKYNVILQIGGSDQWGNIISGIHLTRCLNHNQVYGLTFPLITKQDGTKFGKTEEDVIWLDPRKTSPYKFYQFWINTSDNDVYRFLKLFTLIDVEEINELTHSDDTTLRPQSILAKEVSLIVHGKEGLAAAQRITDCLFRHSLKELTECDFMQLAQDGIPSIVLKKGAYLQQALVEAKLAISRGQARTLITANAISVNGEKTTSTGYQFQNTDLLYDRYTLLRRGKKHYCLIDWKD